MAIRYTKEYNKEIRQAVKHFNSVRSNLSKKGIKLTPSPMKVSELKARYQTRRELNKELTLLNKVSSSSDSLLRKVENQGGATAIKWNLDYLKLNEQKAIDYYERERELILKKVGRFPGERTRLDNIEEKLNYLKLDKDYMNQEQFRSYQASVRNYLSIPAKIKGGYRGFLIEVEEAMKMVGYSKDEIDSVFDKLSELSPNQFHQFYEENELVGRIYEFIQSPKHHKSKEELEEDLTTSKEDIKSKLGTFITELDDNIEKYKNK